MQNNHFTKTEIAILNRLSDGRMHARRELRSLIDEQSSYSNLSDHVSNIRKKLPPGEDIVCVARYRRLNYQHVRLLKTAD
jgi:hypothetical protein